MSGTTEETIEIYGISVSNYVRAVRMVCEEKGIAYTLKPVLPHAPEVTAIHPLGKIPVLRHGKVELGESKAIATYLERTFPQQPLFPSDPVRLAQLEQWVSLVNTTIDRTMVREYTLGYFLPSLEGREPDRAKIDAALPALRDQIAILDRAVAATGYLVGDSFTYADVNLLPILSAIQSYPEGTDAMASTRSLRPYFERHTARASFQATVPAPFTP